MFQALANIPQKMIYQRVVTMYYRKINLRDIEECCFQAVIALLMRIISEFYVQFLLCVAPGPGVYRLPSDFGHYDELPISGRSSLMGRTTARSKFIQ